MSVLPHDPGAHRERVRALAPLLDEIVICRQAEKEQQCRRGITAAELARLRGQTLGALEDYAAALETLSWPVPRALLQEIRLHKALLGGAHPASLTSRRT